MGINKTLQSSPLLSHLKIFRGKDHNDLISSLSNTSPIHNQREIQIPEGGWLILIQVVEIGICLTLVRGISPSPSNYKMISRKPQDTIHVVCMVYATEHYLAVTKKFVTDCSSVIQLFKNSPH